MTVYTLDSFGNACADFNGVPVVDFAWPQWAALDSIEFELLNVSQSIPAALLSMMVSFNGCSTFDNNPANYFTGGSSHWIEGLTELGNITEGQWPISVDIGDNPAFGNCGNVTLWTRGVAGGNNANACYRAIIQRSDGANNALDAKQGGFYTGNPGVKVNGVRFFYPAGGCNMSGTIKARARL